MADTPKQKIGEAMVLIRRGATLLKEPCPNCSSLQVRYKGRTLCINCNDLSDLTSIDTLAQVGDVTSSLGGMVLSKLRQLTDALSREVDVEKQAKLANLILLYMDIIEKIKRSTG